MPELKYNNCPFCNSEKVSVVDIDQHGNIEGVAVSCSECLMRGPATYSAISAIVLWNMLPNTNIDISGSPSS